MSRQAHVALLDPLGRHALHERPLGEHEQHDQGEIMSVLAAMRSFQGVLPAWDW